MKKLKALTDLTPDAENANEGTLRGSQLLARSMERGAARSIMADKHGRVIAGNKTLDVAVENGLGMKLVKTDGKTLVVVQRTDLDLAVDPSARELAFLDNRSADVGLKWDPAALERDLARGLELGGMFSDAERQAILDSLIAAEDRPKFNTTLSFDNPEQQERWLALMARLPTMYPEEPTQAGQLMLWVAEQMVRLEA